MRRGPRPLWRGAGLIAGRKPWAPVAGRPDLRKRGRAGQAQRLRRLKRTGGLCEHCLELGRTVEATIVNHKTPLARGGADVDDNTENLCAYHDRIVTAAQFGRVAIAGERGVTASGRPTDPNHAWNKAPPGGSKVGSARHRTPTLPAVRNIGCSKVKSSAGGGET